MKALVEKKNALLDEMDSILAKAEEETRAFNEEESSRVDEIKKEVRALEETLKAKEEARAMEKEQVLKIDKVEEKRALEEANFIKFLKGEERALDVANNGGIIPQHIANKIIETVKELCPIYSLATVYNVGGDLIFPVYDEASSSIGANYTEDLAEVTEGTGKFTTVKLENYIIGSLAKVSKSLLNRTDFDLIGFVVRKVAEAIAQFLGKELIVGTSKIRGVVNATVGVTAASATAITADELIELQMSVVEQYQDNACWIMHKDTLKLVRKLKNEQGEFLLNKDLTTGFGWNLLGKRVYVDDNMPKATSASVAIAYGDMSGLYVKLAQQVELQMLMEKYATQHAVGVVGYVEADGKIVEPQKIRTLKMKTGA